MQFFNKFIKRFTQRYNIPMLDSNNPNGQNKKQTGRWSIEEHQRFMFGIMQHGRDWKKVQEVVKTRTGSQVRSHAQKFFNKLQKQEKHKLADKGKKAEDQMEKDEHSFSERESGMGFGEEASNLTPVELVAFVKNESQEGKKINIGNLKEKLEMKIIEEEAQENQLEEIGGLSRKNSFKSMNNILSVYETVNEKEKKPQQQFEDESFLIKIMYQYKQSRKKYKKFFAKEGYFQNLIDFGHSSSNPQTSFRKRSFTLPEGIEGDEDDLMERKKRVVQISNTAKMSQTEKENYRLSLEKVLEKNEKKEQEDPSELQKHEQK